MVYTEREFRYDCQTITIAVQKLPELHSCDAALSRIKQDHAMLLDELAESDSIINQQSVVIAELKREIKRLKERLNEQ